MILDILIVILTIFFIIGGYRKGFVKSAFNLIKLLVVIYFTPIFLPLVELFTNIKTNNTLFRYVAYFLIFIFLYILISILVNFITKLLSITPLGIVNKLLGAVFGFIKSSIIILITIIILLFLSNKTESAKELLNKSVLVEYISIYTGRYNSLFPKFISEKLDEFRIENLEKNFKRSLLKDIEEGK